MEYIVIVIAASLAIGGVFIEPRKEVDGRKVANPVIWGVVLLVVLAAALNIVLARRNAQMAKEKQDSLKTRFDDAKTQRKTQSIMLQTALLESKVTLPRAYIWIGTAVAPRLSGEERSAEVWKVIDEYENDPKVSPDPFNALVAEDRELLFPCTSANTSTSIVGMLSLNVGRIWSGDFYIRGTGRIALVSNTKSSGHGETGEFGGSGIIDRKDRGFLVKLSSFTEVEAALLYSRLRKYGAEVTLQCYEQNSLSSKDRAAAFAHWNSNLTWVHLMLPLSEHDLLAISVPLSLYASGSGATQDHGPPQLVWRIPKDREVEIVDLAIWKRNGAD